MENFDEDKKSWVTNGRNFNQNKNLELLTQELKSR